MKRAGLEKMMATLWWFSLLVIGLNFIFNFSAFPLACFSQGRRAESVRSAKKPRWSDQYLWSLGSLPAGRSLG